VTDSGIYIIRNQINGRVYVGSAVSFAHRFYRHKTYLNRGAHHSQKLQRAWFKYGKDAFEFKKILICKNNDLTFYEQLLIDHFNSHKNGYNCLPTAGSSLGAKRSAETRRKISAAATGRKMSAEAIEKNSLAHRGKPSSRNGVKLSEEELALVSKRTAEAMLNLPPESKQKMLDKRKTYYWKGKKRSAETIKKMSESNKGKQGTPCEERIKIRFAKERAKFNDAQVREMRHLYEDCGFTCTAIKNIFGGGLSTIYRIVNRVNYNHLSA
jgi:group I intron endonuclease